MSFVARILVIDIGNGSPYRELEEYGVTDESVYYFVENVFEVFVGSGGQIEERYATRSKDVCPRLQCFSLHGRRYND